jgi:hypothetical protein
MDRIARRVAARWAFKQAQGDNPPIIPRWVHTWAESLTTRVAYLGERDEYSLPDLRTDDEVFDAAQDSIEILLPKFLATLKAKFYERYHMNASKTKNRIYYYFTPDNPIDTIALALVVRNHKAYLELIYVPYAVAGDRLDYKKAVRESASVDEPDVAGLALMRMLRKVLARV